MKKEINEIVALSRLEPTVKTIYVEGEHDVKLYNILLKRYLSSVDNIFSIDTVNVTQDDLEECNLTYGNKQKAIALAIKLEVFSASIDTVVCIADQDFDGITKNLVDNMHLKYTDGFNSNNYLYTKERIGLLIKVHVDLEHPFLNDVYDSLLNTLSQSTAMRFVRATYKCEGEYIDISGQTTYKNKLFFMDFDKAIGAMLNKDRIDAGARVALRSRILKEYKDTFSAGKDANFSSHDFDRLFRKYMNSHSTIIIKDDGDVYRLFLTMDLSDTLSSKLINDLVQWLGRNRMY
jgi:hypothetical protein